MKRAYASFCSKQRMVMEHLKKVMKKEKENGKHKEKGSLSRFMKVSSESLALLLYRWQKLD